MKYRVDKDYSRPLDEVFPELFKMFEFQALKANQPGWQRMFKYIIFMYTKGTPLVNEFPTDLKARMEAAVLAAGYTQDSVGNWDMEAKQLMDITLEEVFHAIMAFLKFQKSMIWTEIMVCERELWDYQKVRFKPLDTKGEDDKDIYAAAKNKQGLKEACDRLIKSLDSLYEQFYGDSKEDLMNSEFNEMITPEKAERIMAEEETKNQPTKKKEAALV